MEHVPDLHGADASERKMSDIDLLILRQRAAIATELLSIVPDERMRTILLENTADCVSNVKTAELPDQTLISK